MVPVSTPPTSELVVTSESEMSSFSQKETERIRRQLGDWYQRHRRDLPWRDIDDPYKTWVAEIMLQQTQVSTVVDYYHEWLARFPDVDSVAEAEEDDVLDAWEGLGYYRRARFIHRSAQKLVDEYGGALPDTADELEELPGIGPYTAGAIASIAFDRPEPVVDGNVSRVLSRLRAIPGDPKSTSNKNTYWKLAEQLVDPDAPGDFNQAMMELGATICTPDAPNCLLCPVREDCRAFERGEPEAYPDTASRPNKKSVRVATCVLLAEGPNGLETYVAKRPSDGLLGGLWEFPSTEIDEKSDGPKRVDEQLASVDHGSPFTETEGSYGGEITHLFSHLRMTIDIWIRREQFSEALEEPPADIEENGCGWLSFDKLEEIPMSAAMRRVESVVEEHLTI
jgi:A/G-specific adenine glycosylase